MSSKPKSIFIKGLWSVFKSEVQFKCLTWNSNFERMYSNSTASITVTPEKYCSEENLKAYGYIVEIYDFTQKNSLIRYVPDSYS